MNLKIFLEKDFYIPGSNLTFYINFSNEEDLSALAELRFFVHGYLKSKKELIDLGLPNKKHYFTNFKEDDSQLLFSSKSLDVPNSMYKSHVSCNLFCFYSLPYNIPPTYYSKSFEINYYLSIEYKYDNILHTEHIPILIENSNNINFNETIQLSCDLLEYIPSTEGIKHSSLKHLNDSKSSDRLINENGIIMNDSDDENEFDEDTKLSTLQNHINLQYKSVEFCNLYLLNMPYNTKSIIRGLIHIKEDNSLKSLKIVQISIGLFYREKYRSKSKEIVNESECISEDHKLSNNEIDINFELNFGCDNPSTFKIEWFIKFSFTISVQKSKYKEESYEIPIFVNSFLPKTTD